MTNLRRAAGSLLVVGLAGTELTGLERAWLKLVRPGGIILFKRNIADARQTRVLLGDATGLGAENGLRCVDVEGGTVNRLRDALGALPSAQAVARAGQARGKTADSRDPRSPSARDRGHPASFSSRHPARQEPGKTGLAREDGELVGRAVRAFGFNTTLAPVLDLGLQVSAEVMGTRTAAETATGVVEYARAFLAGLASQGVVGCGKHFPGLGGGTLDSHLETPEILREGREIWYEDLAPYRELRDELPMVMVNHAAYPRTPGKGRPASVSRYWIGNVLRKRIGYRGIVFSDDLEMGGVLKFFPIEEAAVEAVRAGTDLVEICHSPELILRAYEALMAEGERSRAFREMLLKRAARMERVRGMLFADGTGPAMSARQFDGLRTRILRFGETIAKALEALPA
ncbi:MAG: glycoside hydrolase family 3 N-terminal domain-containing protein [Terracidiphilus sp.]